MSMELSSRIYVAGHTGLVGSALVRQLKKAGFYNLVLKSRSELDLCRQTEVEDFFSKEKIEFVFLAAAKVGGILANSTKPVDFLYENMLMSANVIRSAAEHDVKKMIYLGSSCIYPKFAEQPISESSLLSGTLEPTNEPYAIAKIAGIKLCQAYKRQYQKNFISVMPTNLYGPFDNFDAETSHVIPGLLRRFHDAKVCRRPTVQVWGTGQVMREFLHVDDLAGGLLKIMLAPSPPDFMNLGAGQEISILDLAQLIKKVVGFEGNIVFDKTKPDGTPRKLLDISLAKSMGWAPAIDLLNGLRETYSWAVATGAFDNATEKIET